MVGRGASRLCLCIEEAGECGRTLSIFKGVLYRTRLMYPYDPTRFTPLGCYDGVLRSCLDIYQTA
jgi:hypothetical protein